MDTPFLFISISACYKPPDHHSSLITLQGFPTATQRGGMLRVTTLPAPMVVPSPISTPGKMIAPPPIQTLAPILMDGISAILQWENSFRLPFQWLIRLNGKLSCLLEATDLFHTQKESFTFYFNKTKEYSSSSSNTRSISLTLRYSLNGKSNKYKGTGAGEEEQRRL